MKWLSRGWQAPTLKSTDQQDASKTSPKEEEKGLCHGWLKMEGVNIAQYLHIKNGEPL